MIGDDVVQRAGQRIRRAFHLKRRHAGEEARGTLRVRIGAMLKGSVEPGNQRNLFAHHIQRRERGSESERMVANRHSLALEPPHVVLPGKFRQRAVAFAREKPAARDAVG